MNIREESTTNNRQPLFIIASLICDHQLLSSLVIAWVLSWLPLLPCGSPRPDLTVPRDRLFRQDSTYAAFRSAAAFSCELVPPASPASRSVWTVHNHHSWWYTHANHIHLPVKPFLTNVWVIKTQSYTHIPIFSKDKMFPNPALQPPSLS